MELGPEERAVRDAMDQTVSAEVARLRQGLEAERQRLREVLLQAARGVAAAGDLGAARIASAGARVAFHHREEPARARVVEHAARLAHDRLRVAANNLADEVRALEGELSAPLQRASRVALGEGLPSLRRVVDDALLAAGPADPAQREAAHAATLAQAQAAARAQVDAALSRIRRATDKGVALVASSVEPVPARVEAAVAASVEAGLRQLGEDTPAPRPGLLRRWLEAFAGGLGLLVVVGITLLSMAVGAGAAGAVFGAIVLTGTYAPPVGAGVVTGALGTLLACGVVDLLFNVLGDWRDARDEALLGAAVPARATGRPARVLDLGPVLAALRLTTDAELRRRQLADTPPPAPRA